MMTITKVVDNLPKLKQAMTQLNAQYVDVGYLDASQMLKEDVIINELGDPFLNIPGTHFFSAGVDESLDKVTQVMRSDLKSILMNKLSTERTLSKVGEIVDKTITQVGEDRNVPSHILNGIEYEVKQNK